MVVTVICIRKRKRKSNKKEDIGTERQLLNVDTDATDKEIQKKNKTMRRVSTGRPWYKSWDRPSKHGKLAFSVYKLFMPDTRVFTAVCHSIKIVNRDQNQSRVVMSTYVPSIEDGKGCKITFVPNEVILGPGEAADIEMDIIPTVEGTTKMLIAFTPHVGGTRHPPYYLPFRIMGLPLVHERDRTVKWSDIKLGEVLGKGAAGTVYRAEFEGKVVAVKQFQVVQISQEDIQEFNSEATILDRLKHPCIVSLYGVCIEYPNLALVMEYLELGSLGKVLRGATSVLPWDLRIKIAFDTARGMAFLHRMNFLHRDIKSDNILVVSMDSNSPVNVKLADFSIGKDTTKPRTRTTVISPGSIHWKAPEVLSGEVATKSSDIWSFGIVMWEITTRELPYADKKWHFEIDNLVRGGGRPPIPDDSEMPKEYVFLMEWCWNARGEDRPTFDTLVAKLRHIQTIRAWRVCNTEGVAWKDEPEEAGDDEVSVDEVL